MPVILEHVKNPNPQDFSDLSKVYQDYPNGLSWQDLQDKTQNQTDFTIYAGRFNDHFLGAISVLKQGDSAELSHFWVRDITRGRHVGRDILRLLLQQNLAKHYRITPCQQNPALEHLLTQAGFNKQGDSFIR